MKYGSWNIERNTSFFVILSHFCPTFTALTIQKIQNFENMKQYQEICTKNEDHMMYDSWNIRRDRPNILSFMTIFYPFNTLMTRKVNTLKNWKKIWRYYHFKHVYHKIWSDIRYSFLRYRVQQTEFCCFGWFFALLPP